MHGMTQPFSASSSMDHLAKPLATWGRKCAATATCFGPEARERLAHFLIAGRVLLTPARPIVAVENDGGAVRMVAVATEQFQASLMRLAIERAAPTLIARPHEDVFITPEPPEPTLVEREGLDAQAHDDDYTVEATFRSAVRDLLRCYSPAKLNADVERTLMQAGGCLLVVYGAERQDGGEDVIVRLFPASPLPDAWAIPWRAALAKRADAINAACA
ncbi:hypothetical protein [Neoroseomonas soli]|uniref:Uncharacterized protein n=1 Tax=Neoroseomonas soli TaxID=1081025 RepID=A0A9X9WYL8_9PROT|nr:hypothetical protein [Neoroseomonas soli]MBR0672247.1 hypothetical protein [Neoroseomonas soli]